MQERLDLPQRVVGVIGLGLALLLIGEWVTALGTRGDFGWMAYAPLSNSVEPLGTGGLHPWVRLVIWLVLLALWTGLSMLLLRTRSVTQEAPQSLPR